MFRFVSICLLATIFCQTMSVALADKPPAEALELAEAYDRALLEQDPKAFADLLSDDYLLVDWNGQRQDKAWMVDEAKKGTLKMEVAKSDNSAFRTYGDTVVWTGDWTEQGTDDGEPFLKQGPFITILAKRDGTWQVVSDQVTQIRRVPNIEGVWRLHARIDGAGNVREVAAQEADLSRKFIGGGEWSVTFADGQGGIQFHHGGTYSLEKDVYTESVDFASEATSQLVGSEFQFNVETKGDTLIQQGINNEFNEVWRRVQ